jgi:hypothetical protein
MSVWDLIKAGEYQQACDAADREFSQTSDLLALRNKIFALLRLGRFAEAATLCDEIMTRSPYTIQGDFAFRGVCDWARGRADDAVVAWQAAKRAQYVDAAGGLVPDLLLLFASIKRSDQALRASSEGSIMKRRKRTSMSNWPGPVGRFVIGELDEAGLLSAIAEPAVLRDRQSCQGEFYIAVMRLKRGDTAGYMEYLSRSCSHGPVALLEAEFHLADAEIRAS